MTYNYLVLLGAAALTVALYPCSRIVRRLPPGRTRSLWLLLTALIVLFILGYLGYLGTRNLQTDLRLDWIVPGVFLGGGVFVLIIISLSLQTMRDIQRMQTLEEENITDCLMEIHNRRYFDRRLQEEFSRASRHSLPLTLILFDIDCFKSINDTYGHDVGDQVLKAVGRLLLSSLRDTDVASRFGGDEIAIISPLTDQNGGVMIAERLLELVRNSVLARIEPANQNEAPVELQCTLSVGVAAVSPQTTTATDLLNAADQCLYLAKRQGRNRVVAGS